jgi:hypothetical protein
MKKKLVLMTSALMAIGLLAGCGSKHTHEYKLVDEVAATCTESGVHAHYTCEGCDKLFDEDKKETTLEALTIAALGHKLTAHESHAETCTEAGNCAYWSCERCGKFFSDEEGKDELKKDGWIIPAHAHTLIHNDAKAATCYVPGNIEYWVCTECFQYFSDEACTHPIKQEDVRTPAHHTLTHHEAKNATRLEDGNIEYWTCDVCDRYFSDEEGKNEIDAESIVIPALGTDKTYFYETYWRDDSFSYVLNFRTNNFSDYDICYEYYFSSFDYDDETKELSFIITGLEKMIDEYSSPYEVGDKISFTYNAEKEALMFGKVKLSKQ